MPDPLAELDPLLSGEGWPHASLTPVDETDPGRFHALFGRDSAITSLQLLPTRPDVARATLRALARLQGTREDEETDEEPGKIVHEWWPVAPERLAIAGWPVRDGELRYYGSADSTSWFLVLLASLGDHGLSGELEEHWRAAGRWLLDALERGGGLIRHGPRRAPGGLAQQGWRDAEDPLDAANGGAGILLPGGRVPSPPLADADTQAVTVAALRAMAALSGEEGWSREAATLSGTVEEAFDAETLAVDGDGLPVPGAGSQLGWMLWGRAVSAPSLARMAERLCEPDILTAWGLRTLSADHPLFASDSYHRGAVWPFDSWLGWAGLRAEGSHECAERVRRGIRCGPSSVAA